MNQKINAKSSIEELEARVAAAEKALADKYAAAFGSRLNYALAA